MQRLNFIPSVGGFFMSWFVDGGGDGTLFDIHYFTQLIRCFYFRNYRGNDLLIISDHCNTSEADLANRNSEPKGCSDSSYPFLFAKWIQSNNVPQLFFLQAIIYENFHTPVMFLSLDKSIMDDVQCTYKTVSLCFPPLCFIIVICMFSLCF